MATKDTGASFAIGGGLVTTAYSASPTQPRSPAPRRRTVAWPKVSGSGIWLMPVTVAALLALGIVMALFLLTTGAVEDVADVVGLGALTDTLLAIVRWPLWCSSCSRWSTGCSC